MNIKPNQDRILVERIVAETTLPSGIVISEYAKSGSAPRGKVMAVGPGKMTLTTLVPTSFTVGQIVLLPTGGGTIVRENGVEYVMFHEHELLGTVG